MISPGIGGVIRRIKYCKYCGEELMINKYYEKNRFNEFTGEQEKERKESRICPKIEDIRTLECFLHFVPRIC